ncbi:hypothetical protein CSHISOI_09731 [Colletotrichum shisoi]|uniref:Uncharacterized protein n=1 Tax=Colletotrichum shisoi TaxID=2078593 RepID=A0A5Q4BFS9_9PEZI|nr:hypothetical protein CSHISOI_09731 [Colletotrichum shisoi]
MARQNEKTKGNRFPAPPSSRHFATAEASNIKAFEAICSQAATAEEYPLAATIQRNRGALQDEWYRFLISGPGVFVTKRLYRDRRLIEAANAAFASVIEQERESGAAAKGDHFASAGKNDRSWNSFGKHGLADPASFVEYYSNPATVYRITAQVNNTKPGASPQVCHRDYHVGFQTAEAAAQIPRAMQVASQLLTLQGAVAHSDVPLESGPTRVLPFSQTFEPGYVAYRRPEFNAFFLGNHVSLPLENKTADVYRMANLLQISSPFGKPMESVDAVPLIEKRWDHLVTLYEARGLDDEVKAFVAAAAEGYPFPTNLDSNPPRNEGMAPESEQDNITTSLTENRTREEAVEALKKFVARSVA